MSRYLSRRSLVVGSTLAAAWWHVRGAFAEELLRTPAQTEGPFYPDKLPLDTDNDLIALNDDLTPAVGEITYLSGRVLDAGGSPIRGTTVEIWQCDAHGVYLHSGSDGGDKRDKHFQGFGRFVTGRSGEYLFRTIKPVPYPGRTPHIHFAVEAPGHKRFVTQMYVAGAASNERDGIFRSLKDAKSKAALSAEFTKIAESKIGELAATFDIVLGDTPSDDPTRPRRRG